MTDRIKYTPPDEVVTNQNIGEVKQITKSRFTDIQERKDIEEIVETPLVTACQEFYDKNIQTIATSANKDNLEKGYAYIIIDTDSLSLENKKISEGLNEETENYMDDKHNLLKINIPIDESTTPLEIQNKADEISNQFVKQKMTWAKRYTMDDLNRDYFAEPEDKFSPEDFPDLFYNKEEQIFYLSKEHNDKYQDSKDL